MHIDQDGNLYGTSTCLWEAAVKASNSNIKSDANAFTKLLRELGKSACLSYQEIGVTPTNEGWVVNIRSAGEDGAVDILIPKDRKCPVQVLKDSRAGSRDYRDGMD